jgi:hypothetical protein
MSAPSVYAAINAVSAELAEHGIAKSHVNEADDYKYRSIDDLLDRLAPLLAKHRFALPRALKRTWSRHDEGSAYCSTSRRRWRSTSSAPMTGHLTCRSLRRGARPSDKATAKAMSGGLQERDDPDLLHPACAARIRTAPA